MFMNVRNKIYKDIELFDKILKSPRQTLINFPIKIGVK